VKYELSDDRNGGGGRRWVIGALLGLAVCFPPVLNKVFGQESHTLQLSVPRQRFTGVDMQSAYGSALELYLYPSTPGASITESHIVSQSDEADMVMWWQVNYTHYKVDGIFPWDPNLVQNSREWLEVAGTLEGGSGSGGEESSQERNNSFVADVVAADLDVDDVDETTEETIGSFFAAETGVAKLTVNSLQIKEAIGNLRRVELHKTQAGANVHVYSDSALATEVKKWPVILVQGQLPKDFYVASSVASDNPRDIKFEARSFRLDTGGYASDRVNLTSVKVIIKKDELDITDSIHDVIVGNAINLVVDVEPAILSQENVQWYIPGEIVANWQANVEHSILTEIEPWDLQCENILFYWVDGCDNRVLKCEVKIEGKTFEGNTTFNVKRPVSALTISQGAVDVGLVDGKKALHLGSSSNPGIVVVRTISIPAGFSGATEWVQLCYPADRHLIDGEWEIWSGSGLDDTYPYSVGDYFSDSPGTPLLFEYSKVTCNNSSEIYLLFKPSGQDSIYVPLKVVNWSWSGEATHQVFEWIPGTSSVPPAISADTTRYPAWSQRVQDGVWRKENQLKRKK
jgi:hypothetical protein